MMRTQFFLFVQLALALAVMWSCLCRLMKTDADTHREIRWSFLFQLTCAGIVFGAPLLPALMPEHTHWRFGTTPQWAWLMLLLSVWLVQVVTSRYWREGVPASFQRAPVDSPRTLFGGWLAAPLLLLVAVFVAGPRIAVAQAAQPDDKWREVESDMVFLPQGSELRCTHPQGCIAATTPAMRGLLREASGTCGNTPALPNAAPLSPKGRRDV